MSTSAELIEEYKRSNEGIRQSKRAVTLVNVLALGVFGAFLVWSVYDFGENDADVFSEQLTQELRAELPFIQTRLGQIMDKVMPVYGDNLERELARAVPELERRGQEESEKIWRHYDQHLPRVTEAVNVMIDRQREILEQEFAREFGAERGRAMSAAFVKAAATVFHSKIEPGFVAHLEAAKKLEYSIEALLKSEPDIPRPVDPWEASGLLLEYAGLALQRNDN